MEQADQVTGRIPTLKVSGSIMVEEAFSDGASTKGIANEDLSAEIARTVTRSAREQVTCRRISHNHYRCNWWTPEATGEYDNPQMQGLLVTTNRITKSQFLRVTRSAGGLEMENLSTGMVRTMR
jgi:hypothetical protein